MNQITDDDYRDFSTDLKRRVGAVEATVARVVNRELILLYWDICPLISRMAANVK